ncbi:helix-turn-helix domain-containing protein [Halorubrum tibetense]|uniref:Helix-turn-helix domain-containing protein n=1 Tax=Halorubrum tibetense TaxID=175631 RepID=A0ABD5S7U6_9EURY
MREVTLQIYHKGEPECEVSSQFPEVTLRSVSSMTGRTKERKRIIEITGPATDIEGFLGAFREADSVIEAEPLSPIERDHVYVALVVDAALWDSISERLSDLGIHHRMGTTINSGIERWTLYLNDDEDLSGVMRSLERGGNEVTLVRNVALSDITRPPQLELTGFLEDLTSRQRETLATAIELGYYEHGGGVGIEEISDALALGSTTAWEHLSRAEAKVMAGIADQIHP